MVITGADIDEDPGDLCERLGIDPMPAIVVVLGERHGAGRAEVWMPGREPAPSPPAAADLPDASPSDGRSAPGTAEAASSSMNGDAWSNVTVNEYRSLDSSSSCWPI